MDGCAAETKHAVVDSCTDLAGKSNLQSTTCVQSHVSFLYLSEVFAVEAAARCCVKLETVRRHRCLYKNVDHACLESRCALRIIFTSVRVLDLEPEIEQG